MGISRNDFTNINIWENEFSLAYIRPNGAIYTGDSLQWLKSLPEESVDLIFADPPYNIKKAAWDKFNSQEEYIQWSMEWIKYSSRLLKSSGSLYICGYSEILSDLKYPAMKYFDNCRWLIWHYKNKANLGNDWGRSHESILHLRKTKNFVLNIDNIRIPYSKHTVKYPSHPQADSSQFSKNNDKHSSWSPNPIGAKPRDVLEIPTLCNGMEEKTKHPTQKPEELLRRLILSATNPGDLVLDPFSGSGTALVAAEQLQRRWLGCDINPEYNSWAIQRIDKATEHLRSIEEWIAFDRANEERRKSIR